MRALCIDHEGGFGGSSRSLYYLVEGMDKSQANVDVWLRKGGPIQSMYESIGIRTRVMPELPVSNTVFRLSRNLASKLILYRDLWRGRGLWHELAAEIETSYDLVHFNHTNLYPAAQRLRPLTGKPFSMHMRSAVEELYEGSNRSFVSDTVNQWTSHLFARSQTAKTSKYIDSLVFISEYEKSSYRRLGGSKPGCIIHNPISSARPTAPHPAVREDTRFKVACIENYRWSRGTDRLVEIAAEMSRCNFRDAVFVVAGDMSLPGNISGPLGELGRGGGTLQDYVDQAGLSDWFQFLGHVSNPEDVMYSCDALISLTRRVGPWGRSVIEAMNLAKPVIATGPNRGFVSHWEDGIYREIYNGEALAADIIKLASDRSLYERVAARAKCRIVELCGQPDCSNALADFWEKIVPPVVNKLP